MKILSLAETQGSSLPWDHHAACEARWWEHHVESDPRLLGCFLYLSPSYPDTVFSGLSHGYAVLFSVFNTIFNGALLGKKIITGLIGECRLGYWCCGSFQIFFIFLVPVIIKDGSHGSQYRSPLEIWPFFLIFMTPLEHHPLPVRTSECLESEWKYI